MDQNHLAERWSNTLCIARILLIKPYFASMFAMTSGGSGRSVEKGFPGAKRIRKKDTVIKTNIVGIASNILFAMNLSINSLFQSVTI